MIEILDYLVISEILIQDLTKGLYQNKITKQ